MTPFVPAALAAALLLAATPARAQGIDFDLERLRLDPGAHGSLLLGDGVVLPNEEVRLSATYHYERRPLVRTADQDLRGRGLFDQRTRALDLVSNRSTVHLGAAIGLLDAVELGLEVPFIVHQSGESGALGGDSLGAPWMQLRYGRQLFDKLTAGVSFATSPDWGSGDAFNGGAGWSFVPALEAGYRLGGSLLMANVRALLRSDDVLLTNGETLSHELQAALGWATVGRPLRFEVSAHGAFDVDGIGQSAELLGGVRYTFGRGEMYALAGPGFAELPGTPTFRALVGLAFGRGGATPPPAPVAAAPAPAPAPKADPCAPGAAHTPEQCPALDDDRDGVANAQDRCPVVAGIAEVQGCPAQDTDGDAIADHVDRCPQVKGVAEAQGCPPPDSDKDGIADAQDRCPAQPGIPAEQGCPPARAQINVATRKIDVTEKVYFDTGKATIQPRSYKLLDDVAALLAANPTVAAIHIEGHTDDRGPLELNKTLSQQRAEAVKAYLVEHKVDAARLSAEGFGPDRPAQPNTTAAGREANRRVEFVIRDQKM